METISRQTQSFTSKICTFLSIRIDSKLNLKSVFFSCSFLLLSIIGFGQTTSLSFSQIPMSDPEIIGPGRGAENWNDRHMVALPSAGSADGSMDSYYRFTWTDIQDYNSGAYKFTLLDQKVQAAIDRGSRFNWGVMAFYPGTGPNVGGSTLNYPLTVHNAMQAEPVYKDVRDVGTSFPGYNSWTPNWNAPSFRSAYNAMIDAMIAHMKNTTYKGIKEWDAVGYVDIRTYGNTGEWTGYNPSNNPSYMPSNTVCTAASMINFISDFVARIPDKQLLICTAAITGSSRSDGVYPEVGYKVFTTSNNVGRIGLRRDCLGETSAWIHDWFENNNTTYNGLVFKDQIMNFYKYAPWGGEPCSCCTISGGSIQYWDLARQITYYHTTFFGNGNLENGGDATVQNNIRTASKNSGYRLVTTGGTMPTTLSSGGAFNMTLNWQNIGNTPTYENWNIVYELRKSDGTVAWTGTSSFKLRLFIPQSTSTAAADNFTLTSVANGTYNLYMIVKDPSGYRKPLTLGITGRNSDGSYLLRSNITVGAGTGNKSPTANAGSDQTIQLPTSTASLTATGADADGTVASYAWAKVSGPSGGTITSATQANTSISGLVQGVYVFSVTVTDNLGATGSDNVQITVNSATANQSPVAKAGSDVTITLPTNTASLNAGSSADPDGSVSSYLWTLISGPSQYTLGNNKAASTTASNLTAGIYSFQLKVTDNAGAVALDTIKITVNAAAANQAPIANAGGDITISLPTNVASLNGNTSVDPDGSIASYAWKQVSGPSTASIGTSTSAAASVSGLVQGTYVFSLTIKDNSGLSDLDSVKVTVSAAANVAPTANAGSSKSLTLPTNSTSLDASASSDPDGSLTAYSWTQLSGPSTATLSSASKSVATASNMIAGVYTFQIMVTDDDGATAKASVKITVVSSGKQPPVANAGADQTITLPTNTATISGSGSSASSGSSISTYTWSEKSGPSTVTLSNKVSNSLTNLVAGTYIFYLTVTDNNSLTGKDSVIITVKSAGNQTPIANAGSGFSLTLPVSTATLDGTGSYDPDGSISSYAWTWISGPNTPSVSGTTSSKLNLSGLVAGLYTYSLKVTDNKGATATAQVKITVIAQANSAPVANAGSNLSITAPTSSVTLDGSASSDPGGSITKYGWVKVSGPGNIAISNSNTAKPYVTGLAVGVYIFELTVTDNSGSTAKDQVSVYVNAQPVAQNQAPVANAGNNITIQSPVTTATLNGKSSYDPDGTISAYGWRQVSGPTLATFSSYTSNAPSLSKLNVGQYVFELAVTDNNGSKSLDQVTVTVKAAATQTQNVPPVANAGVNDSIGVQNTSYTLNASQSVDPDGSIVSYQWNQIGGPNTVNSATMNDPEITISDLQVGNYIFQVTVTDDAGATSTAIMSLTVGEPELSNKLTVYPNPAHSIINERITSKITGKVRIFIYDMNGRMVIATQAEKSGEVLTVTTNVDALAPGLYTVQIILANRKTITAKFIKS